MVNQNSKKINNLKKIIYQQKNIMKNYKINLIKQNRYIKKLILKKKKLIMKITK